MRCSHFTPMELQFFATAFNQLVILPTYNDDEKIYLSGKTIGPFRANHETIVPAWLALFLKDKQKCKILVPDVFQLKNLADFIKRENLSDDPIYLHEDSFFQLAYTLLNKAPDTFEKPRQVRSLVQSLETIRFEKMRKLIEKTSGGRRLKYFTTYEVNKWRSGLSSIQKMVDKLQAPKKEEKQFK